VVVDILGDDDTHGRTPFFWGLTLVVNGCNQKSRCHDAEHVTM